MPDKFGSGKPEEFYNKIEHHDGKYNYGIQSNKIYQYVQSHFKNEFIILTFLGKSQDGKSHLIQNMSGVKHKTGMGINLETEGATIEYAGTISDHNRRVGID